MRKFLALFISAILLFALLPGYSNVKAEENETLHYLALGDSLAAGVTDQNGLGKGYSDFLAENFIESADGTITYNKGFAFPGYRTEDLLADIQKNVEKPIFNLQGQQAERVTIKDEIKKAQVISISIGANDVLQTVKRNDAGGLAFNMADVFTQITTAEQNVGKIIDEIKAINSEADIIFMGFYNPFPYLEAATQTQLTTLVNTLDSRIGKVAKDKGAIFVEVKEEMAEDVAAYLPNPENVHPSEAGYEAIALAMYAEYLAYLLEKAAEGLGEALEEAINEAIEEALNTPIFTDIAGHGSEQYITKLAELGIVNGYGDGRFGPNDKVKRVNIVQMIVKAYELESPSTAPFTDIDNYAASTKAALAVAYDIGLVRGYEGNKFKPNDGVTRAQLALMIARLYEFYNNEPYVPAIIAPFNDISSYNVETQNAITLLYDLGMAQGVGNGKFAPGAQVTRAQAAKILALSFEE